MAGLLIPRFAHSCNGDPRALPLIELLLIVHRKQEGVNGVCCHGQQFQIGRLSSLGKGLSHYSAARGGERNKMRQRTDMRCSAALTSLLAEKKRMLANCTTLAVV